MTTPRKPIDEQPKDRKAASRKVDEASAESMDASDPPSFNPAPPVQGRIAARQRR